MALVWAIGACGPQEGEASDLDNLQLVGVDFQLNSIILENQGSQDVLTENLWIYRDGEAIQLDIFTIEPRSPILFSMRELGDISSTSGEIALANSETTTDPDSLLAYVAWGTDGFELDGVAADAELWPEDAAVETDGDTLILQRVDLTGTGPETWTAVDEIG